MSERVRSVLMSGAGTGGHLFPGLAVAQEIRRRYPTARVVFAGTGRGRETGEVTRQGYEHERIRSAGLKGKSVRALIRGLSVLPVSAWDAWRVVSRSSPDIVVGLGGYSAGAVVLTAAVRRIPTLVLEQNAIPGITNRLLARVVTAAAVSHDAARLYFRGKAFVSGNPVRAAFFESRPRSARARIHVLVAGGSQGAHAINNAMVAAAPRFAAEAGRIVITHQTGEEDCAAVRQAYDRAGMPARVEPFIEQMVGLMHDADIVVCRAGATTLAELAAVGRPAILVPLPGAADNHQHANAQVLVRCGAAELLCQSRLTGETLAARLLALAGDDARRRHMADASLALARPDAARVIVDRVEQMAGW